MNHRSRGIRRYFTLTWITQVVVFLTLAGIAVMAPKKRMGPVDDSTFTSMSVMLLYAGVVLTCGRGNLKYFGFGMIALLVVSDVLSGSFWQRVFSAPWKVVLYWIAVLALGLWRGHTMRRESEQGTWDRPHRDISRETSDRRPDGDEGSLEQEEDV